LKPGGKVLFGDIPNQSLKERFINSKHGKTVTQKWKKLMRTDQHDGTKKVALDTDTKLLQFNDELVFNILENLRGNGYHAYVIPQPPELPFGNTREDILVVNIS
jgi:hypothetical protein